MNRTRQKLSYKGQKFSVRWNFHDPSTRQIVIEDRPAGVTLARYTTLNNGRFEVLPFSVRPPIDKDRDFVLMIKFLLLQ